VEDIWANGRRRRATEVGRGAECAEQTDAYAITRRTFAEVDSLVIASRTRIYGLLRTYVLVMETSDANEAESGDMNWVLED
jgi:hypothetical protein